MAETNIDGGYAMRLGTRVTFHPSHPLYRWGITGGIVAAPPGYVSHADRQRLWVSVKFVGRDNFTQTFLITLEEGEPAAFDFDVGEQPITVG